MLNRTKNNSDKKIGQNLPKTTGHEWDGIEEYTNPDPVWLRIVFYCTLFFGLIYWMLYPSWPAPHTPGILNWSSESELLESQKEIDLIRAKYQAEFDAASFNDILKNPKLLEFAIAGGSSAFQNNCSPCHGVGGTGRKGYPNLTAGAWLWGGTIDDIYTTIKYGIRSDNDQTRESQMGAFGKDKILTKEQVAMLAKYIQSLGVSHPQSDNSTVSDVAEKLFADNCASCHGKDATGGREFGAPNLRDAIWLYGSDYDTIYDVIYSGRGGIMPYWTGKLPDSTIRQLAIYVHQLGGGE